jgi:hypothetical protein
MLGLGLGTGKSLLLQSYTAILIKAFKARVAADIGIFEAESCLKTTLQNLDKI